MSDRPDPDDEPKGSDNRKPDRTVQKLLLMCVAIAGIQVVLGLLTWNLVAPEDRGTFGDMFGAVNTLFSGLAFAAVVYAILLQRDDLQLQREDLRLQREELRLTRAELERSAQAHQTTADIMQEQLQMEIENSRPRFALIEFNRVHRIGAPDTQFRFQLEFKNSGGEATGFRVSLGNSFVSKEEESADFDVSQTIVPAGGHVHVSFNISDDYPVMAWIDFDDTHHGTYSLPFTARLTESDRFDVDVHYERLSRTPAKR